jgi:hypothetical protein
MKLYGAALLVFVVSIAAGTGTMVFADDEGNENTDSDKTRDLNVQYSEVRARVSPTFELALPSSKVTLSFTQPFNRLDLVFYLGYGIVSSDIDSELTFAYNINRFRPFFKFFQRTDFENLVAPGISGSGIVLVPTEKYIARNRGFDVGVGYRLAPKLYLEPSFLLDDVFKGSLTTAQVLTQGIDLVPKLSLVYDGLKALDPSSMLYFRGLYYRTIFSMRYRNSFDTRVQISNENLLLYHFNIKRSWFFLLKGTLNYPITVWKDELASSYKLGGFETIRGYEYNSINAFSFLLLSFDTEREFFKDKELMLLKERLKIHQFRMKLLTDSLLFQDSIGMQSDAQYRASLGAGLSFVLSGQNNGHFRIELFMAQGLQSWDGPILYFRTSLYNFETSL